jgi:hypothetical protein
MALSPAEKQRRYRERQSALEHSHPDAIEHALLEDVARAERGELSTAQCAVLANKLADMAMRHLWRAQELSRTAQKVRPLGWNPPGAPGRE